MAQIVFSETMKITNNLPNLFNLTDIEYRIPWIEGNWEAYKDSPGTIAVTQLINSEGVTDRQFIDVFNMGITHYLELNQVFNVGDHKRVTTVRLGINEETGVELDLCIDLERLTSQTQGEYLYRVDTYLATTDTVPVIHDSNSQILTVYTELEWAQNIGLGVLFYELPDREGGLKNSLVTVFLGYGHRQTLEEPFTLYRYNETRYDFPQSNSGFMLYKYMRKPWDLGSMAAVLGFDPAVEYTSAEAGDPSQPGGYTPDSDKFDDSSDTIGIPTKPTIGVTNVGFVNVYKTGVGDLQDLGEELFPELQYTGPTQVTASNETDAIVNGFNALVTFFQNIPSFFDQIVANTLINYIIDCHIIPVEPTAPSTEHIKVGYRTLSAFGSKVTSDYVDVDCGELNLKEYYTNFADFLTTFKLYLPFVGYVSARPEWFYYEKIQVYYRFNVIDGSFMAYVLATGRYVNNMNVGKTILAQYSGNACVHIPITGVTYASMVSGVVGASAGAVQGLMSGNIAAVAESAIAAAAAHGDISQSNSYNATASFLGVRRPYAVIERPVSDFSEKFAIEKGIPSNIAMKLGNVTGFSMIGDVHLDGIDATEAEKLELERLLHEGVIL